MTNFRRSPTRIDPHGAPESTSPIFHSPTSSTSETGARTAFLACRMTSTYSGSWRTPVAAIDKGVVLLASHPTQRARLQADPTLIAPPVEEVLRQANLDPAVFAEPDEFDVVVA